MQGRSREAGAKACEACGGKVLEGVGRVLGFNLEPAWPLGGPAWVLRGAPRGAREASYWRPGAAPEGAQERQGTRRCPRAAQTPIGA